MIKTTFINNESLAGQFLVASPNLNDHPDLARKVIYVILHDREGGMGVMVNNIAANISLETVLKLLGIVSESDHAREKLVHIGGSMESECGIVLHSNDYRDNILIETPNSILVSSDSEILRQIASGLGPEKSAFFLGYTGWESGQLEREIKNNDWITLPYNEDFLFNSESKDIWQEAINSIGIKSNYFSKTIGHA